jgi:ABC-type molybdate transport system ATPase subunit
VVDVVVDVGVPLHAEITVQASSELGLAVGMPIFALIKSAAISRAAIAERS